MYCQIKVYPNMWKSEVNPAVNPMFGSVNWEISWPNSLDTLKIPSMPLFEHVFMFTLLSSCDYESVAVVVK